MHLNSSILPVPFLISAQLRQEGITVPIFPLVVSLLSVCGQSDAFKPFSSSYILYDEEKGIYILCIPFLLSADPNTEKVKKKTKKNLYLLAQNTIIVS